MSFSVPRPRRHTVARTSEFRPELGAQSLDEAYHIPHNVAFPDEFHLLLRTLAWSGPVPFRSLVSQFFEEQIKRDQFRFFHPKPHEYFTNAVNPSDLAQLAAKLGSMGAAQEFAQGRARSFRDYQHRIITADAFMESAYKPGRSWRQVWVEYPRDYLDFAAMLQLAVGGSRTVTCEVAQRGSQYLSDPTVLDDALLEFTISVERQNSAHRIRPFWLTLALLDGAHRKGVYAVETRKLMRVVSHLSGEEQYPAALNQIIATRTSSSMGSDLAQNKKEAQRFSLPVRRFLEHRDLAKEAVRGRTAYLSITRRGRLVIGRQL